MPLLVVTLKGRVVQRLPVAKSNMTIGRDAACDLQIDNAGVSRLHAALRVIAGSVYLVDVGSSNGTVINGKLIQKNHKLEDRDEMVIGKYRVVYEASSGPDIPPDYVPGKDDAAPARTNPMSTVKMSEDERERASLTRPPNESADDKTRNVKIAVGIALVVTLVAILSSLAL